jgi:hypothetical protein
MADASFRSEARDAAVLADGFGAHAWQGCAPVFGVVVRAWIPMTSAVGQGQLLAGRYRLQEPVAAGGAGRVWRAMDLVLERMVAVKLLRPEDAGDPLAAARFLAEARSASRLSHPGIAQVHDYGDACPADVPFLVMELVDGPSLAEVLLAGPLDPDRTMDVLAQVAAGLHAARMTTAPSQHRLVFKGTTARSGSRRARAPGRDVMSRGIRGVRSRCRSGTRTSSSRATLRE